jgi:hypothetical protein
MITNCLNGGADCSRNATPYFWWDPIGIQALFSFDHSATDCKVNAVLVTTKDAKNVHKIK